MKVFISHSHRDSYIARKIADDISAVGVETFLDDKDMKAGHQVSQEIDRQLRESDYCLILLTPNSLTSKWILFEAGKASALEKKIVPVISNLDKNQAPEALGDYVFFDINTLHKFIDELKSYSNSPSAKEPKHNPSPQQAKKEPVKVSIEKEIKVGNNVSLPKSPPPEAIRASENIGWVPGMNPYLGRSGKVLETDEDNSAKLDVDGGKYWYAFEWLS